MSDKLSLSQIKDSKAIPYVAKLADNKGLVTFFKILFCFYLASIIRNLTIYINAISS